MSDTLNSAAVEALRLAAERLGVDPFRLARFLGDGKLGDILEALGRPGDSASHGQRLSLAEDYLRFLDHEIEEQDERRGRSDRQNGN